MSRCACPRLRASELVISAPCGAPNNPPLLPPRSVHLIKHQPPQQCFNPCTFQTHLMRQRAQTKTKMAKDELHLATSSCRAGGNSQRDCAATLFSYTQAASTGLRDLCFKAYSCSLLGHVPQTLACPLKSWLIWQVGLRWAGGLSRTAFFIFTHFCSRCLPQFADHNLLYN